MITAEQLANANSHIKTIDIKGKEYAEVHERVKAFRAVFPDYSIITDIKSIDAESVTMVAIIEDPEGRVIATGHANESKSNGSINRTSYVENCETSAVGRALGNFGVGIKSAFSSANEVIDSIRQEQADLARAKENPTAQISKKQVQDLKDRLAQTEINESDLCKFYGIDKLEDLTLPQLWALAPKWTETVNKILALKRMSK